MDKAKLVLVVGLVLILGAALTGCVDSTQDPDNGTDDGTTANTGGNTGGSSNGGGGGGSDDGGNDNGNENVNPTVGEVDIDVENMTAECEVQERVISPEETDDVDKVYSQAGPAFDERKAENMLHEELNKLRTTHGNDSIEPFVCDPYLREIAQEHSRVMAEEGFLGTKAPGDYNISKNPEYGNLSVRYQNVCDSPVEIHGRWLYQRNMEANWDGVSLSQRIDVAQDHEDLVRDMRGVWFKDDETMDILTDENLTRQGIGMHIDRSSRLVHVTQAVC